ncbi:MAG TPA: sugar-binding protein, partial [Clostridia bacterium]
YKSIGDDFIEQAFLTARQELDAHPEWGNIRLFYNDYNEDNQAKATAIYNMVKDLNDKYASTHPGKLLIDGIGMQAHYMLSTNPANVKSTLERYASLGVKVAISELDIQAGSNYKLTDKQAKAQGYLFAQLMDIFKAHASDIVRVTFWGLDDGTSWRSSSNPTPFNSDLQAKMAYYGVIDPDKYMAENPPEAQQGPNESKAIYGTPVIDGTVDAIWNNAPEMQLNRYQMAWQGAAGTAKALWDDKYLYVLAQVNDTQLDKNSANAYEQDSVEVFVDQNNGKTPSYESDDGQYRVNYNNEASFNPGSIADGFVSATQVSGTNYTVEMKIPLKSITPKNGDKIGFDAQINDAKDGARQSVAAWNDTSGIGYQDTSVYGILTLDGKSDTVPSLTPSEIKVNDKSLANVTIDIGENTIYSIKNGAGVLTPNVDYTVSGKKVTISKWYLGYYFSKFPDHNLYLDFNFKSGNSARLTVYTGSTPYVVMTDAASYNAKSGDVQLSLVLNGNFPTSVKNGAESLIQRIDYTYAPSTQIFYIRKGYLNTYFSKTSEPLKLTVNFTGDSKTVVITPVK